MKYAGKKQGHRIHLLDSRYRFHCLLAVLILILAHVTWICVAYINRDRTPREMLQSRQHASFQHFKNMLAYQGRMDSSIPDNSVLFLGDSITQRLAVTAVTL